MWVLRTPLTHKTTHKNFKVSIAAPAPDIRGSLAEVGNFKIFQVLSGLMPLSDIQYLDTCLYY
jgi:hypothetical protein